MSVYDNVTLENRVLCGLSVVFTNMYNPRAAIERKDEYRDTLVREGRRWAQIALSFAALPSVDILLLAPVLL